jgi:hypothetical protein
LDLRLKVAALAKAGIMSVKFAESNSNKPSVSELATFASRANEINLGGSDDFVELGDDMGIGLLTNPNKMAPSPRPSRHVSMGDDFGSKGMDMPQIHINPMDDLGLVDLDAAPGATDIRINREPESAPFVINGGGVGGGYNGGHNEVRVSSTPGMNQEDENRKKQEYLTKLQRLDTNGIKGMRMTMTNSLEEIKSEYDKLTDSRNLEASIRFQRNALMTFVTGVEMVNDKFGNKLPIKPRLKGWSESVHTNVEDFDEIFEELYDLYKDSAKMHPMVRLVGTLGVSATMYHLTNSMAERSGIPGMGDLLNENPELRAQFASAAAAKMGGLGQFMNAASGMGPPGMMGPGMMGPPGMMGGPAPMGSGFTRPPPTPPRTGASGRGPMNSVDEFAGPEGGPRARREMRGPVGVDDVLKAFEAERNIQHNVSIAPSHGGVFSPNGAPPTPPRGVSILREGIGSSVDPMADFLANDEGGSVGSGSTMNPERRRGRKRAVATPVGATLNLNV